MPADEVTHGADAEASRVRTGPRHAAPRKPLFTRFHVPAGKAIALAAMPTAVLMGMGFTPTLAAADGNDQTSTSKSLTADEYKACVAALTGDEDGKGGKDDQDGASASATASPSASASGADEADDDTEPSPSATGTGTNTDTGSGSEKRAGSSSSSDSGSDDETAEARTETEPSATAAESSASPSATASGGGVLEGIGDALEDLFTGGKSSEESASATETPSSSATPSASASASAGPSGDGEDEGAASDAGDEASEAVQDAGETVDEATASPTTGGTGATTTSPTPSASASAGASTGPAVDCPIATDAEGGVDNTLPLPNRPWELEASSLTLKGASYKGIVEVRTADGTTKKVLKYVVSNGTDIGDLHQIVHDETTGKTHHVQAAEGSTSTIRDGDTVMYTESISGNLLGLIPITFDPEHPPPLDIPLIYFTNVKVVQAGQFGGTLTVPGLHQYMTD
ncbi:hypothetical protein SUDANB145_02325 [Streptomyces sp. enrichment culture]|uniref:hypothetical protein n=1 Tax=Streptomyces sp. enrichment culture TaxID=1795815 RepID=UPI003F5465EB